MEQYGFYEGYWIVLVAKVIIFLPYYIEIFSIFLPTVRDVNNCMSNSDRLFQVGICKGIVLFCIEVFNEIRYSGNNCWLYALKVITTSF